MSDILTGSDNALLQMAAQTGGRIMVVDDEEKTRHLLGDLLAADGYTVQAAVNGLEALKLVTGFKPETILLDIMMPKLDGVEACRRLKADTSTASIPVLLVTALHEHADRLKGIQAGADDFLTKPIDREELRLRVRNAVFAKRLYDKAQDAYAMLKGLENLRRILTDMIIHDMRSPLMIISYSYDVITREPNNLNQTQKESVTLGKNTCQQLIEMVTLLLDVSRMEEGKMPLSRDFSDIRDIAQKAVESVAVLAQENGLILRVTGDSASGAVDRAIIQRVFVNLLGNAIKFSPRGGIISIHLSPAEETVRVTVTDQGPGIPSEYHQRIFEKFGQVESRKENKVYSTGLGLTFCKLAVEAHGGKIGVESRAEQGSRFWFTLPTNER